MNGGIAFSLRALLQSVAHLNIAHTKLTSLAGLSGLSTINGDLIAWDNANLVSLQGLGPVTQLFGKLWMDTNPKLQDMTGLEVRTHVFFFHLLCMDTNPTLTVGLLAQLGVGLQHGCCLGRAAAGAGMLVSTQHWVCVLTPCKGLAGPGCYQ